MKTWFYFIICIITTFLTLHPQRANAQAFDTENLTDSIQEEHIIIADFLDATPESIDIPADTLTIDTIPYTTINFIKKSDLPLMTYIPVVFDHIEFIDSIDFINDTTLISEGAIDWLKRENDRQQRFRQLKQSHMLKRPDMVKYNLSSLPEPPKKYEAIVDPSKSKITIQETTIDKSKLLADVAPVEYGRKNWLHTFEASLQFSQAFVSPNWYQGGNNNVNTFSDVKWNVKLNNKFHPNLLLEATVRYRLAMNNAPQDSIHDYAISQDLFEFYGDFGYKAHKRWYYSVNTQFKTQLLNNYKTNSHDLKAAFMSPGEVNVGVGMTYNYANKKKTFSFDASINPLSYNMKISTHPDINETSFGIKEGKHTVSDIGSNTTLKFNWNIKWNITYSSRLYAFTDYSYVQGDWEHTINFSVNRYLSTKLYIHLHYDTNTTHTKGWNDWQLKEILTFGLQYKFSTV